MRWSASHLGVGIGQIRSMVRRPQNHTLYAGTVSYETIGSAPNRKLVVNFNSAASCCGHGTPDVTVQAILYEGTNVVEIHTTHLEVGGPDVILTQGLENENGTVASFVTARGHSRSPPTPWITTLCVSPPIPSAIPRAAPVRGVAHGRFPSSARRSPIAEGRRPHFDNAFMPLGRGPIF